MCCFKFALKSFDKCFNKCFDDKWREEEGDEYVVDLLEEEDRDLLEEGGEEGTKDGGSGAPWLSGWVGRTAYKYLFEKNENKSISLQYM